jgi:two-component system chemotaxis sensor kinase CheA
MDNIVDQLRATFRDEAYELLAELEAALLALEKVPDDRDLVGRAFRAMHTIKGSGAACEFHDIVSFTHDLETAFDMVRKGKLLATREIIDIALSARDQIKAMLDAVYQGGTADPSRSRDIAETLRRLTKEGADQGIASAHPAGDAPSAQQAERAPFVTYRIRFRPQQDVLTRATDPVTLLRQLGALGPCNVVAHTENIPCLEDYQADKCYTSWDVVLTTSRGIAAIRDLFLFVKDDSELSIDVIDEEDNTEGDASYKRIGEILLERGDISSEDLQKVLQSKKRVGEMLTENGVVSKSKVRSALIEQQHVRDLREKRLGSEPASSIRVSTERLDKLVNLVGELVTVQARLSQSALSRGGGDFLSIAEEMERLSTALRDTTMSIRMLPIGTTFSMFRRVVRDLSAELGKEIELVTEGADTELDKTVIEKLSDPLVHLIRNSIDHGIEPPDVRTAAGKPRHGTIHLAALHSKANVLIQIRDDGAGMDREAILATAVERGLIPDGVELPEKEIFGLVLTPGFSTAKTVTNISGRGVGLDVVKRAIDVLRGTIEIASERGMGTTITLRLPLTLAIIDGFLTTVGAEHYIFPLALVEECVELTRRQAADSHGRNLINVRGRLVPYIRLRDQFQLGGEAPAIEQIVIVQSEAMRIGFAVDHVVGSHQTVIKNLGNFYRELEGISGATILGDGTVALILDVPRLVQTAEREESRISGRKSA